MDDKNIYDYVIVGSGITGILAAEELISKGFTVATIDIGADVPIENITLMKGLAKVLPKEVVAQFLRWRETKFSAGLSNGDKELFGFAALSCWIKFFKINFSGAHKIGPAVLKGGYSRVWGGVCMPSEQAESFVSTIPCKDSGEILSDVYKYLGLQPNKSGHPENERERSSNGLTFSKPLIANNENVSACNSCGLCLQGCPQSVIFDSSIKLQSLQNSKRYQYLTNLKALHIQETAGCSRVYCANLSAGASCAERVVTGKKILLAAGPLASSEIACRSLGITSSVGMACSGYFTAVALRTSKIKKLFGALRPKGFDGLSRIVCGDRSKKQFFLQFYSAGPIIQFYALSGRVWLRIIKKITGRILESLVIPVQGYLDSSVCQKILVTYKSEEDAIIIATGRESLPVGVLSSVKSSLKEEGVSLYAMKYGLPGAGYHFGCSFPMRGESSTFSSNLQGVPSGLVNTHMIDASILPSIPAGPFTTVVLWNALRIVRELSLGSH